MDKMHRLAVAERFARMLLAAPTACERHFEEALAAIARGADQHEEARLLADKLAEDDSINWSALEDALNES